MRRFVVLCTLVVVVTFFVAACGSSAPPTPTPIPTTVERVSIRNSDSGGGRFTVQGIFHYQDGSTSAPDIQTVDIISGDTKVVTFTGAARRSVASFEYQVVPPTKMVPRTVQSSADLSYTTENPTGTNRGCGFLFSDTCASGSITVRNTDSAGGPFTVKGTFTYTDGTTANQTKTVSLLSGQAQAVTFDEVARKTMKSYNYTVVPPKKDVSQIVQDEVQLTFVAEKTESLIP
jgi:hypothetical protein